MRPRRKLIVMSVSIPGLAILLVGGYLFGSVILEESYLRDLATYDEVKSREAAEWLGRHGSVRAMRRLFDLARELARRPDVEILTSGACNSMVRIYQAIERIAIERRRVVVPLLLSRLAEAQEDPGQANQVRMGAANCLRRIGPDAREAVPALREALKDGDERFRGCVSQALREIEGP
jgi:hypothetical protein